MAAQTLSLGQAGYSLLAIDPAEPGSEVLVAQRGTTTSRIYDVRNAAGTGVEILNLGIGVDNPAAVVTTTANVFDPTQNLTASLGDGSDTLNLYAAADGAQVNLDDLASPSGDGNDLLNAQRSFTNSAVATGDGRDTVRVGGTADGSSFFLGGGNDSLYVAGASQGVTVDAGDGADILTFVGQQTDAQVFSGGGNDSVTFTGGLTGSTPGDPSAFVATGDGNDTVVFGTSSTNTDFALSTGSGADQVRLAGSIANATIWLGGDTSVTEGGRDSVSMVSGTIDNTSIASNNNGGDTIVFGANTSVFNTAFSLGDGNDSLVLGGTVMGDTAAFPDYSQIQLGLGADTLTFGAYGSVSGYRIDLGNDGQADVLRFLGNTVTNSITITGADEFDILYIGTTAYNYVASNDIWTAGEADTIKFGA